MSRANDWLRSNPEVTVRTCQTVTWSSHDLRTLVTPSGGAGELMILSRGFADNAATYYLRGLRYSGHSYSQTHAYTHSYRSCLDLTAIAMTIFMGLERGDPQMKIRLHGPQTPVHLSHFLNQPQYFPFR